MCSIAALAGGASGGGIFERVKWGVGATGVISARALAVAPRGGECHLGWGFFVEEAA